MSACSLRYVYSNIASMDCQTLKLIKMIWQYDCWGFAAHSYRGRVAVRGLVAPDEARAGVAEPVDRVDGGYEFGDARVIQWRDQPGDVVLRHVVSHRT